MAWPRGTAAAAGPTTDLGRVVLRPRAVWRAARRGGPGPVTARAARAPARSSSGSPATCAPVFVAQSSGCPPQPAACCRPGRRRHLACRPSSSTTSARPGSPTFRRVVRTWRSSSASCCWRPVARRPGPVVAGARGARDGRLRRARAAPALGAAGSVMGGVALLALATGRRRTSLAALGRRRTPLVLLDPWLARSYGFVLSTLATAALVVLAPGWTAALREPVCRPAGAAVAVPLAAQAGLRAGRRDARRDRSASSRSWPTCWPRLRSRRRPCWACWRPSRRCQRPPRGADRRRRAAARLVDRHGRRARPRRGPRSAGRHRGSRLVLAGLISRRGRPCVGCPAGRGWPLCRGRAGRRPGGSPRRAGRRGVVLVACDVGQGDGLVLSAGAPVPSSSTLDPTRA